MKLINVLLLLAVLSTASCTSKSKELADARTQLRLKYNKTMIDVVLFNPSIDNGKLYSSAVFSDTNNYGVVIRKIKYRVISNLVNVTKINTNTKGIKVYHCDTAKYNFHSVIYLK